MQAMAAAALEIDVEVVFVGAAVALALPGTLQEVAVGTDRGTSVRDLLQQAHAAGVLFKVCPPPFLPWEGRALPEIDDVVDSAYLIQRAVEDDTTVLTY
jgi:predicted peroxiredoxin